ncbi:LANO_0B03026g1_1 [Lachancea nothofagi CBS 11611]|uniref:LANO_0B03026g1_1 n=1 Tax=Lachancea nothofagi CBS 11611 TaxID=1266666 RepID=A0A1G4IWV1_9SACH|nr:LANO_0B03026g1_1 [Lachancea nothofagi CBS 11611]
MTEEKKAVQKRLKPLYDEIMALKEPNGLEIYPIFQILPPRKDYPDYYKLIQHPMSLSTVKKRLNNHYNHPQEFVSDLAQITWNARTYNTKQSDIYTYASIMDTFIRERIVPELQKQHVDVHYPNLGPLPDEIEAMAREHKDQNVADIPVSSEFLGNDQGDNNTNNNSDSETHNATNDDEDDDLDDEYTERKKPLPKIRIPPVAQSPAPSSLQPPSHSMTPTPLYQRHQQQKTHMRRGRPPVIDLPYEQRIKNVLKVLKKDTNERGENITAALDRLPDEEREPQYYTLISNPISIDDIRKKVKQRKYKTFQAFQQDFKLAITNYQLYHRSQPADLRRAAELERRFSELAQHELSRSDEQYMTDGELKYPLNQVDHNGTTYKIGDWILINNSNDATKPTIAQIFRLWHTSDGRRWLNACWYLRPEQTVHRVDRLFYKNEVVKSGQYRDHLVDEIVGKCYVCHFTRFQRGDPDLEIEGPLFVCEFRYNESEKVFNKIRTWKGCLPEEIRDVEEATIPVLGRKFFKYDSPIKHLLPPNATVNDPIPMPTEGAVNAPPLVGAVYLRPKVKKDDLGEYSTSDDCPRYIMRPGDPVEHGKLDVETGTVVTNMQTTTALPKGGPSTTRLASLTKSRSGTGLASLRQSNTAVYNPPAMKSTQYFPPGPTSSTSPGPLSMQQTPLTSTANATVPSQTIKLGSQSSKQPAYRPPTIINSLAAQARTNNAVLGTISTDTPLAYVLPLQISKNVELLQRADYSSQLRRLGKDQLMPKRKRSKGEVLWFRGPSVAITERLLNSKNEITDVPLNRWFKKRRMEYEEVDAEDNDYMNEEQDDNPGDDDSEDEDSTLPGTFPLGLRPSAAYMAHKIAQQQNGP